MLPRWDPGGVRPTPNVPRDQSRTLAPSRYPYAPYKGHLVNLTSQQRWQDLCMFHMNFNIFIHGKTTETNNAMTKITSLINVNIPALTRQLRRTMNFAFYAWHIHALTTDSSSHMSFTVTATSYIRVTKILKLHVETTSRHTSHPSFS